jgi:hypothetical protein
LLRPSLSPAVLAPPPARPTTPLRLHSRLLFRHARLEQPQHLLYHLRPRVVRLRAARAMLACTDRQVRLVHRAQKLLLQVLPATQCARTAESVGKHRHDLNAHPGAAGALARVACRALTWARGQSRARPHASPSLPCWCGIGGQTASKHQQAAHEPLNSEFARNLALALVYCPWCITWQWGAKTRVEGSRPSRRPWWLPPVCRTPPPPEQAC